MSFLFDFQEYLLVSSFRHQAYCNESNQAHTSIYQASYYTCIRCDLLLPWIIN